MSNSKPVIDTINLKSETSFAYPLFGFEKTNEGTVLITLLQSLQIELKNFDVSKTTTGDNLYEPIDRFRKVSYPLVSSPDECLSIKIIHPLISFSDDSISLELFKQLNKSGESLDVITISKESSDCTFVQGNLWIANLVHIRIAYTFAQNLQQFLITGEVTDD